MLFAISLFQFSPFRRRCRERRRERHYCRLLRFSSLIFRLRCRCLRAIERRAGMPAFAAITPYASHERVSPARLRFSFSRAFITRHAPPRHACRRCHAFRRFIFFRLLRCASSRLITDLRHDYAIWLYGAACLRHITLPLMPPPCCHIFATPRMLFRPRSCFLAIDYGRHYRVIFFILPAKNINV